MPTLQSRHCGPVDGPHVPACEEHSELSVRRTASCVRRAQGRLRYPFQEGVWGECVDLKILEGCVECESVRSVAVCTSWGTIVGDCS